MICGGDVAADIPASTAGRTGDIGRYALKGEYEEEPPAARFWLDFPLLAFSLTLLRAALSLNELGSFT